MSKPTPISRAQRDKIITLLEDGLSSQQIASQVGVEIQQVAAVKAHITMGTYGGGGNSGPETGGRKAHRRKR